MQKSILASLVRSVLSITILLSTSLSQAADDFIDIDLTHVTIGGARGVEPEPFILFHDLGTDEYFINIMTLNSQSGAQLGTSFGSSPPPDDSYPVAILWSNYFMPTVTRGIEPEPFIVFGDYGIYHFPLTHAADGTPMMAGDWEPINLLLAPGTYGNATCAAEMAGTAFDDGKPRLYIGTDEGYIFWLVDFPGVGIVVEGAFTYNTGPVLAMEPIPQFGYVALGALIDNTIYGFIPEAGAKNKSRYLYNFLLFDPRADAMTDFSVIGPKDVPLSSAADQVKIVIANGTSELGIATVPAEQMSDLILTITPDMRSTNIKKIVPGSLLMLPADGSTVLYDPHFNGTDGSSECSIDLSVQPPDPCYNICGDVDNNGLINILDIVYLVNFKYKGGMEPYIFGLGDVDGSGDINILDIVYLINFKYKEGLEPICP